MLRQTQQEEDENLRHELDNELDSIRSLLFAAPPQAGPSAEGEASAPVTADLPPDGEDKEYDQYVRELALDRRAKPKDRTKTEEELALEEKEALEKAERRRQRRRRGEESESEDEGEGKRKQSKPRGGDDLDDDFVEEEGGWNGLGAGLGDDVDMASGQVEEGSEDEDDSDEETEEGEDESNEEGESVAEEFESASEESGEEDGEEGEEEALVQSGRKRAAKPSSSSKELPYTFPCPETHDEFLEIVEDIDDKDVPTVIKRIRTLYHPSLAEENKFKLQVRLRPHPALITSNYLTRPGFERRSH